jgi:medium-chain acyl-[acyl-carrier-protein] hydrolase
MNGSTPPTILLYCFAYAGGSAQVFKPWSQQLASHIKVRGIELPGRGWRMTEPLQDDYPALVELLTNEVAADLAQFQQREENILYATFGHSAGATLSFAVAARLTQKLQQPPVHCFMSAGTPPHIAKKKRAAMNDAELSEELRRLSGTPPEVLADPELLSFFLPMLRADFRVYENSTHDCGKQLDCPLTLFAANQDELPSELVWEWSKYTAHPVRKVILQGDHFSILKSPEAMLSEVSRDVALSFAIE